jgi:NSS family neurotransmitter:Na+ symporter
VVGDWLERPHIAAMTTQQNENPSKGPPEQWSGRAGFILAAMGSAVGLGSIWKFPYEVGSNGGGIFILFYLLGLALIVWPLMLVEFALGRRGQADAADAIANVAEESGASRRWGAVGLLGIVTSALILSFYCVIGGWTIAYVVETAIGGFATQDAESLRKRFDELMASPLRMGLYHTIFFAVTAFIVSRGVKGGIEKAAEILMPLLILLLIVLAGYSLWRGDPVAALRFLFAPDFSKLSARTVIEALGLGMFSIGVGLAVMVTYSAYADKTINLRQAATTTIVADTAISFLAGLAIFPIVFAERLDPSGGPGLMFISIPLAFSNVPFGGFAAMTFFVLLSIAALNSAISLLEMPTSWLHTRRKWSRNKATWFSALVCWALGWISVLSFNLLAGARPLADFPHFANTGIFDLLDQLTSNMLLPLGGFLLAILAGWFINWNVFASELDLGATSSRLIRLLIRYITPLAILLVTAWQFV